VLILETHATSLDNEAGLASGWYDVDLSPTGERQAQELGVRRASLEITNVFCSDLIRSRRTADIAFGSRGIPIHADRRLRECHYGDLTRSPSAEIEARRLDAIETPFPNGESYTQAVARVQEWLTDSVSSATQGALVVIGHRATFYAFEHLLKGVPLRDVIGRPWQWRPGWSYVLPSRITGAPARSGSARRRE
jgi:broad specificity phosphatase PhoE